MNQSPSPTRDGSLVLGSQHTTVFLLDSANGELLRAYYDFDGELGQFDNPGHAASLGEASCFVQSG